MFTDVSTTPISLRLEVMTSCLGIQVDFQPSIQPTAKVYVDYFKTEKSYINRI